MPTEIQITNRDTQATRRITATLRDSDTGDVVLDVIIKPGEAVIVPLIQSMTMQVSLDASEAATPAMEQDLTATR